MLNDLLQKKESNTSADYITKKDFKQVIDRIMSLVNKESVSPMSSKIIKEVIRQAQPTDDQLKSLIKQLIPEPKEGKPGKDGESPEFNGEKLIPLLREYRGPNGLYIDNIKGLKKHLNNIQNIHKSLGLLNDQVYTQGKEVEAIREHVAKVIAAVPKNKSKSVASADGSVIITSTGGGYDLSVSPLAGNINLASGVLTSGNNNLELTLTDLSVVNVDVSALNSGGSSSIIVSTDAGNDIVAGTDGGAFFTETATTITNTVTGHKIANYTNEAASVIPINETVTQLSFTSPNLTYTKEDGTTNVINLSTIGSDIDWTTVTDWDSFVTSITDNWSTANWDLFTLKFFSELSTTEIDNFINQWDGDNYGNFIDNWVSNTSAGDWDTFITSFINNVNSTDVMNFLNQAPGVNQNDAILWDTTLGEWYVGPLPGGGGSGNSGTGTAGEDISVGQLIRVGTDDILTEDFSGDSYKNNLIAAITYPITWTGGIPYTSDLYAYSIPYSVYNRFVSAVNFNILSGSGGSGGTNIRYIDVSVYDTDISGFKTGAALATGTANFNGYNTNGIFTATLSSVIDTESLSNGRLYVEYKYTTTDSDDYSLNSIPTFNYKEKKGEIYVANETTNFSGKATTTSLKNAAITFEKGSFINGFVGLATGTDYYAAALGSISTTGSVLLGVAINSTTIKRIDTFGEVETSTYITTYTAPGNGFLFGLAQYAGPSGTASVVLTIALDGSSIIVARPTSVSSGAAVVVEASFCVPVNVGDSLSVTDGSFINCNFRSLQ